MELPRACWWSDDVLHLVDQRDLPFKFESKTCTELNHFIIAIKDMLVRGAPAIGAVAGFGMAVEARMLASRNVSLEELIRGLKEAKEKLDGARPTAVNLAWATGWMFELAEKMKQTGLGVKLIAERMLNEAQYLADEDVELNKRMAEIGVEVVQQNANILTHCNTGTLATVSYGTAIGIMYKAHEMGKNIHVWVDETRPRLQGAKLTAWELMRAKIPLHLIADNASGLLMYSKKVDVVLFGADRVTLNGDVANKIGTMKVAVCAHEFGIPVYAVVPTSTIDLTMMSGSEIVIEERDSKEVTTVEGVQVAPDNVPVYNPGFDITPYKYLTGIITEEGICYPPYALSLQKAKMNAENRIRSKWETRLSSYLT